MEKLCQSMEKSSAKIHWMKEALDEWTAAMARGDETNKLIEKYCKEDRKRAEVIVAYVNKENIFFSTSEKLVVRLEGRYSNWTDSIVNAKGVENAYFRQKAEL